MTTAEARELFAYDHWANDCMFEAALGLSEQQQQQTIASSFPSVASTLAHIVGAEWVWLRRWIGESPTSFPEWVTNPRCAAVRAILTTVEQERDEFLARLSDDDLQRSVSYRTLGGQEFCDPLGGLMKHVVNHSTYHRGQVATLLRQFGVKPPSTDLIAFLRSAR